MAQRKNGDGRVPQNLEGYVTKKARKNIKAKGQYLWPMLKVIFSVV